MKKVYWVFTAFIVGILILSGCAISSAQTASPSASPGASATASPNPLATINITTSHGQITLQQIAEIQPGMGTVMIEYATRMDNLWFAAQKSNWDMVRYQIDEMLEIQEVGETTRPSRAAALKSFETGFLNPLDTAAQGKDLTAFTTAYDAALAGCNSCHATSSSTEFPSYKFVKIVRPTAPVLNNVDWAGQ